MESVRNAERFCPSIEIAAPACLVRPRNHEVHSRVLCRDCGKTIQKNVTAFLAVNAAQKQNIRPLAESRNCRAEFRDLMLSPFGRVGCPIGDDAFAIAMAE